ncbi:peptidase family S66 [Xylaria scruposa]|nr:peptidase family S66 [Xylaria scruposa]
MYIRKGSLKLNMSSISPIRAKALKAGDTIALISPSDRLNISHARELARAKSVLTSRGYQVHEIFTPDTPGSVQSSISNRLSEFREAFMNPSFAAVICTIGGTSFTELLPGLLADKELHAAIRAHPKVVLGCSDITGVHWFLYGVAGLRTFYGPGMLPELSEPSGENSMLDFNVRNLFPAISTAEPIGDISRSQFYAPYLSPYLEEGIPTLKAGELLPNPGWTWIRRAKKAEGRLFGGFLMAMVRLAGVRAITPDWRGRIVFIETAIGDGDVKSGNPLHRVQAAIADLLAQGVFDEAAGLVIGRPYGYNTPEELEAYMAVFRGLLCEGQMAAKTDFPILFGVDFGHTLPVITLPFDALAVLDGENDRFAVIESGVLE